MVDTENLFIMGNSESPSFSKARALKDCVVLTTGDGNQTAIANYGFSVFNHVTDTMKKKGKNIWKLKQVATVPGLKLVEDTRPWRDGHFMIAPEKDMPIEQYLALLEEFTRDKSLCEKLTKEELNHG